MEILSKFSTRVPAVGECFTCPYVNECNGGEKCLLSPNEVKKYLKDRERNRIKYQAKRGKQ